MTKTTGSDLSMLGYLMIRPSWLIHLPAYQSDNARIVRACMSLLAEAMQQSPCGVLPATPMALSAITGLNEKEVIDNYKLLTEGWTVKPANKTRQAQMQFEPMVKMGTRFSESFSNELIELQNKTALAVISPDLFESSGLDLQGKELVENIGGKTQETIKKSTKVRRRLPDGVELQGWAVGIMESYGIKGDQHHNEVWEIFTDIAQSSAVTSANWQSRFRMFIRNGIKDHLSEYVSENPKGISALERITQISSTKAKLRTFETKTEQRKRSNIAALDAVNDLLNRSRM